MKIEKDRNGRRIYKFSHSVFQGGYLYAHQASTAIADKEMLRNALHSTAEKNRLIDVTIKIYERIFFIFCMIPLALAPQKVIDAIQCDIASLAEWEEGYLFKSVYDLQESYVREYLAKEGYDYDEG